MKSYLSTLLSLEHKMDEINENEVHHTNKSHQVSTLHHVLFKSTEHFVRQLTQKSLLSQTPMTLPSIKMQSSIKIYHHAKTEPNQFINIQTYATIKVV